MSDHVAKENAGLVSICIPLYNKVRHVERVLNGILTQPYQRIEVVVSDNGSDDGSTEIARDIAQRDSRVRYYRVERTVTLNESWRLAMRLASGEFCKLQSADDTLDPAFLPAVTQPLIDDPTAEFTVCREAPRFVNVDGIVDKAALTAFFKMSGDYCRELTFITDPKLRARRIVERNATRNELGNIYKVLYRRVCLPAERWRQLNATYPMPQSFADWDFLVRLFLNHRGLFVDQVLCYFEYDSQSPFIRLLGNPQMQLAAALQDYFMPLTILTDPTLSALRECLAPAHFEELFNFMQQKIRSLAAAAARMDNQTHAGRT